MGIQTSTINSGPVTGFKNKLINGNFDFWQRGTSFSGAQYGADRWFQGRVTSTSTFSRQTFTLGQTDVPDNPTYWIRYVVASTAGTSNYVSTEQRVEDVRTLSGQQVTVSFWAKADSAKPISVELYQNFGTGGTPSSAVTGIGVTKTTLSTSWQRVTVTATLPSVSGKTLGTNNDSFVGVVIWFDAGFIFNARTDTLGQQSGTFDIAQAQLEQGPIATTFESRPQQVELALCQRYFEKIGGDIAGDLVFHAGSTSGQSMISTVRIVPKRARPTVSVIGTWTVSSAGQPTIFSSPGQSSFAVSVASSVSAGSPYAASTTSAYLAASIEL